MAPRNPKATTFRLRFLAPASEKRARTWFDECLRHFDWDLATNAGSLFNMVAPGITNLAYY